MLSRCMKEKDFMTVQSVVKALKRGITLNFTFKWYMKGRKVMSVVFVIKVLVKVVN